ncbi:MAG: hypothetical protein ACI9EA_001902 [Pseudomonadales bacterium]
MSNSGYWVAVLRNQVLVGLSAATQPSICFDKSSAQRIFLLKTHFDRKRSVQRSVFVVFISEMKGKQST